MLHVTVRGEVKHPKHQQEEEEGTKIREKGKKDHSERKEIFPFQMIKSRHENVNCHILTAGS